MNTIAERVAKGAAFLDERDPGWWRADVDRAIDLGTLELRDGRLCVLGQRCPLESVDLGEPFLTVAGRLSGLQGGFTIDRWATPFGFTAGVYDDPDEEWPELTAEWKRVIKARRAS